MIPIAELLERLKYDPETGSFTRIKATGYRLQWKAGAPVGRVGSKGYVGITLDKQHYKAHRVAWAIMTGAWPTDEIDHINGVKNDNRWCNLREATRSQNVWNTRRGVNNKSGYKGVHRFDARLWRATVGFNNKKYEVGLFRCPTAAYLARIAKVKELHGEFANAG